MCKDGGMIFLQKSRIQTVGKPKKCFFFRYFVSEIPNFSYMGFFQKFSKFRRGIPLREGVCDSLMKLGTPVPSSTSPGNPKNYYS